MGRFFRSLFSFLGTRSKAEDRIAAYLIREHDRGRAVHDIVDDPYVKNRCSAAEVARVLERPDVVKAVGDDIAEAVRDTLARG